jgi:hypothetical protein
MDGYQLARVLDAWRYAVPGSRARRVLDEIAPLSVGITINKARRTVCWQRLEILNHCLPRQYRDPEQLYLHIKREHQNQPDRLAVTGNQPKVNS